jgi:hypothetical protein
MQFENRERSKAKGVRGSWLEPDTLGSTGAGRQSDDVHDFYRPEDGSSPSFLSSSSESRPRRPIRIVASHRGAEWVSLFESARNRVRRIPTAWRVVAGIVVLLSALELYMVTQSPAGQSRQDAISAIARDATIVQDGLRNPPIIAPAG